MNEAVAEAIMLLAIIGLPVGGWLTDVWFKKNVSSRMLFPSLTIALNAVVIFAAFSFLDGKAQYMTLLLMGVLASMFVPPSSDPLPLSLQAFAL